MNKPFVAIIAVLAIWSCAEAYDASERYQAAKKGTTQGKILSAESTDSDYNYTLGSGYSKHKVLQLADVLANANLFAATGYVRDHGKKRFVFLEHPPIDKRILVAQSRKLRKMANALMRTDDGDYRLAGELLSNMADSISSGNVKTAKRQLLVFEEFYSCDLQKPVEMSTKEEDALKSVAQGVMGEVNSLLDNFKQELQQQALGALNLQNVIGGI